MGMTVTDSFAGDSQESQWREVICICIFLTLAVLAVFGQTAHFDFVGYDDQLYVFQNPMVEKGISAPGIGWAFTHAQVSNWIPLTTLSHMLDCQLFGLNAGGHHLVNVLLHAANVVLLFLVLRQMTGSLWRSAFVAALFAVHPLRAESVAWVSERKDVLSGFFFLLTIWAYVRQARKPSPTGYVLVILLFTLGLMAKSMAATLPFVLLLLDYWPLGRMRNGREFLSRVWEKIPLFILSAAVCTVAALMPGLVVTRQAPLLQRVANALVSYLVYLRQMIFPAELAAHYPLPPDSLGSRNVLPAFLLLTVISAWVVACRKKRPSLLMGWLWYVGMLFPVIGIIQISSDASHADRYTYLPGIGLTVAAVWAVADWGARWKYGKPALACLSAGLVCALAVSGYSQTSYWRDDESLWRHTLACTSENGGTVNSVAYNGLGNALSKKGEKKEAIFQYEKALQIDPSYALAHYNLAIVLFDTGETGGAIAQYRLALSTDPNYAEAHNGLARALLVMGENKEALNEYRKALQADPNYAEARYNWGNALLKLGKPDEAMAQYRKALETTPEDTRILNNLGIVLAITGKNDEAIARYRKALEINPAFADARYDLGAALAGQGKFDEAIIQYRKALNINPSYAKASFGLGKALLHQGEVDAAMGCFQKARTLKADPLSRWLAVGDELLDDHAWDEAIVCYREAIKINPRSAEACANLGLALSKKGAIKETIACWQESLKDNPDQPGLQNGLAWLLATSPDASLRNGAKAVTLAQQANQSTGDNNLIVLHTLAAAYAEVGRFEDAATTARGALVLAEVQNDDALAAKLPAEIKLYEANRPMREKVQ
jgi:tetratricopeptide (TPR) repeat protein